MSCRYEGRSLGYELFHDGQRAGFEPLWGREHAAKNCRWNRDEHPTTRVTCSYEGAPGLGYEVFVDGARVGFEPTWSRAEAVAACEQKRTGTTAGRVSCKLDGRDLGYELLLNGARAGYEPTWTRTQALANCEQNRVNSTGTWVSCRYDGVPLGYEVRVDGARAGFQPTWSRIRAAADCQRQKELNPASVVSCMYEGKVFSMDATTMSVMSFEVPWKCDPATKPTGSDDSTSGDASMRVPNGGWGSCVSPATFRCDQVKLGSTVYLDVKLPPQKNIWYSGEVQLFLDVPSKNKFNQPVARFDLPAQVSLTADQVGRWITVSASAQPILAEMLGSGCADLKLRMTVNPDTAGLLIDSLR